MSGATLQSDAPLPAPAARGETLLDGVLLVLAMTVVQRLVGFARSIAFCRWLELEQLGQWDVAFSFLNLAAPLVVLGLPGSFGRYVEHYRQRGQIRAFLRRTTALCGATAAFGVALLAGGRQWGSTLIFGRDDRGALVLWIGVALATLIVHHYALALLIGLKRMRVVTVMQLAQSVLFALASGLFVLVGGSSTASVVQGFALACLLSTAGSMWWARHTLHLPTDRETAPPLAAFWRKLLPFAFWVWITNLLSGTFEIVDRYMIVHYSGLPAAAALEQVGHYHSSRIIPYLFYTISGLIGALITPHLSHDWEAGRRDAVVRRLNLVLKLLLSSLLAASLAVLLLAPAMFEAAFPGKFTGGLAVMPWTLASFTWFGVFAVAQNYLWCAENARLGSIAVLAGLIVNVALNLALLPTYGLLGAAWATSAANFVALMLVFAFSSLRGMRFDRGTWLLALSPASLWLGPVAAGAVLAGLIVLGGATSWLFGCDEKRQLRAGATQIAQRWTQRALD